MRHHQIGAERALVCQYFVDAACKWHGVLSADGIVKSHIRQASAFLGIIPVRLIAPEATHDHRVICRILRIIVSFVLFPEFDADARFPRMRSAELIRTLISPRVGFTFIPVLVIAEISLHAVGLTDEQRPL